jgi:hypothetical protein
METSIPLPFSSLLSNETVELRAVPSIPASSLKLATSRRKTNDMQTIHARLSVSRSPRMKPQLSMSMSGSFDSFDPTHSTSPERSMSARLSTDMKRGWNTTFVSPGSSQDPSSLPRRKRSSSVKKTEVEREKIVERLYGSSTMNKFRDSGNTSF